FSRDWSSDVCSSDLVGPGSSSHLGMAMLEHQAGISLQQIPYPGFPQIITSILNNDVQAGFMVPGIAMAQVKAGKARALAITSLEDRKSVVEGGRGGR